MTGPERINFQYSTDLNFKTSSSQRITETLDNSHRWMVAANKELNLKRSEVEQAINIPGPVKLVLVGDTHLFSTYSSEVAVKMTFDQLDQKNAFGIVTGDFIEGMNPHISDHPGSVELDFGNQIVAAANILRPYFYSGKLLAVSEGFFGHEGWAKKNSGISAVEMMARMMPKVDPKDPMNYDKWKYVPVLIQGGLLKLKLYNGKPYIIKVFHDPNSGGSDNINRQGGLKTQFLNEDDDMFLDKNIHADMYIAGHQHHRSVVSKEVYFDRMTRKEKSVVFIQIGTSKGIEKDNLDPFLVGQGKGPAIGPGPVIVLDQSRGSVNGSADLTKESVSYGYENANDLAKIAEMKHKLEDLLDTTERQNLTQELLEKVIHRINKPNSELNIRASGRSPKEKSGRAPLFDELKWKISDLNGFPILVYLLQNARYGSSSREGEPYASVYKDILNQATTNPFKYILAMRHFVNKGVANNFDRREILEEMAADLSPINKQKRLLGLMLSSTLLDDGWQKDVVKHTQVWSRKKKKYISVKEVDEGFRPGDELYYRSEISGVPLYVHESIMYLNLGNTVYSFFILDKLGRSGSEFNLVQGPVQTRKKEHVTTDITTGGHMPLAGFSIYPPRSRFYIVPGGLSNWDSGGKGNDKRVATAGQGAVLYSDRNLILPTSSLSESKSLFNGAMLDKGLTESEKRKINSKTK
jgi:hypothetical protein